MYHIIMLYLVVDISKLKYTSVTVIFYWRNLSFHAIIRLNANRSNAFDVFEYNRGFRCCLVMNAFVPIQQFHN